MIEIDCYLPRGSGSLDPDVDQGIPSSSMERSGEVFGIFQFVASTRGISTGSVEHLRAVLFVLDLKSRARQDETQFRYALSRHFERNSKR
jgi:hypothetical protein